MKTIEIKGWIFAEPKEAWEGDGLKYSFSTIDFEKWANEGMRSYGKYVKVAEHTIVAEVRDDVDPTASMIHALNAEKDALRKAFNAKLEEINDRIAKLQALTFDPTGAVEA